MNKIMCLFANKAANYYLIITSSMNKKFLIYANQIIQINSCQNIKYLFNFAQYL